MLAGAVRIAHFTEMSRASTPGPYACRSWRDRSPPRPMRAGSGGPRNVSAPGHHWCLRDGWGDTGAAELRRRG